MQLYKVTTGDWIRVDEASVLGAGGEGRVYGVVGAPALAAKIFDDGGRPEREEKLRAMLANPPTRPPAGAHTAIAWPEDLLAVSRGAPVVGYVMARVGSGRVIDDYYNPQARMEHCPLFHYEYLLVVARNLAAAVRSLHRRNCVIGDVKQSNILVTPNALVTLVDTDSFQMYDEASGRTYRCPVGTPEYTPPELQGLTAPGLLAPEHDVFGLGALIFQLLMEGAHPFAGAYMGEDDPPPVGERVRMGWFPYDRSALAAANPAVFKRQIDRLAAPFVPARKALPFAVLPPELQGLFVRCFAFGHYEPATRPSADEWVQALDRARAALVRCAANSQHRYAPHLATCPWCDRKRTILRGHDPYPAPGAIPPQYNPTAPRAFTRPPVVPPLAQSPSFHAPANSGAANVQPKSGWGAYALVALCLPIIFGLASVSHVVQEAMHPEETVRTHIAWTDGGTTLPTAPALSSSPTILPAPPDEHAAAPSADADAKQDLGATGRLSRDGRYAAIWSGPAKAALVDCRSGRIIGEAEAPYTNAPVKAVAVSPTGSALAMTTGCGITVWDRSTKRTFRPMPNNEAIRALAFSPDGRFLAVADDEYNPIVSDSPVTLIDVQTGNIIRTCAAPKPADIAALGFSPDGKQLFGTTPSDQSGLAGLSCWKVATGERMWFVGAHASNTHFVFSPDSATMAVGGSAVHLCRTFDGDRLSQTWINGAARESSPLCFSPDGHNLAVSNRKSVSVVRTDESNTPPLTLSARQVVSAAFSADGKRLTTLSTANRVEEWDLRTRRRIRRLALPTE